MDITENIINEFESQVKLFAPACTSDEQFKECCKAVLELLKKQPQKGKWVVDEYMIYHCPFCCAINNTFYKSFCPSCGADMRGGQG